MTSFSFEPDNYRSMDDILPDATGSEWRTMLFEALDNIDEPVLIVGEDTQILYINSSYLRTFGEAFEKSGFPVETIVGRKLTDMNDPANVLPTLDVIKKNRPKIKYYSHPVADMTAFTDIIPLSINGTLIGTILIHRNTAQISQMYEEMNRYRVMADNLERELESKESLPPAFHDVIGFSRRFLNVLRIAARVAPSNAAVCLTGESGTGKEVLTNAIHASSLRADGPLIKVNCAAIPENLLESELFGYEKGAFTGAKSTGKPGKFELADGGTLFLDEIGEMPMPMQVKLLRALQEHEITRVGGTKPIKLNFRLITATNKNLENLISEGKFREDLYYRINVIPIVIPPLRERKGDISLLANYFLDLFSEQYGQKHTFSDEVLNLFEGYSWPGNIRELKNCVERMTVLSMEETITTTVLPRQIVDNRNSFGRKNAENYRLQDILDKVERDTIQAVLGLTNGNKSQAIKILGISKRNFYMKLDKYNLR